MWIDAVRACNERIGRLEDVVYSEIVVDKITIEHLDKLIDFSKRYDSFLEQFRKLQGQMNEIMHRNQYLQKVSESSCDNSIFCSECDENSLDKNEDHVDISVIANRATHKGEYYWNGDVNGKITNINISDNFSQQNVFESEIRDKSDCKFNYDRVNSPSLDFTNLYGAGQWTNIILKSLHSRYFIRSESPKTESRYLQVSKGIPAQISSYERSSTCKPFLYDSSVKTDLSGNTNVACADCVNSSLLFSGNSAAEGRIPSESSTDLQTSCCIKPTGSSLTYVEMCDSETLPCDSKSPSTVNFVQSDELSGDTDNLEFDISSLVKNSGRKFDVSYDSYNDQLPARSPIPDAGYLNNFLTDESNSLVLPVLECQIHTNQSKHKENIVITVVGGDKTGKSTVVGHLLFEKGNFNIKLNEDEEQSTDKYRIFTLKLRPSDGYASFDEFSISFESNNYNIFLIDSEISGESAFSPMTNFSDAVILVIDASIGSFELSIMQYGQTREIVKLLCSIGVQHVIVACNKMDNKTVDFSKERFDEIKLQIDTMFEQYGFRESQYTVIPIVATSGDNVFEQSELMKWWNGDTLFSALENLRLEHRVGRKLRIPISEVSRTKDCEMNTTIIGRVYGGIIKKDMDIVISPLGVRTKVKAIECGNELVDQAYPGDRIGLTLSCSVIKGLQRGSIIGEDDSFAPSECSSFDAKIFLFKNPGRIKEGYQATFIFNKVNVTCEFKAILQKYDNGQHDCSIRDPDFVKRGDIFIAKITPTEQLVIETCLDYPALGRFFVHDHTMNRLVAAGCVISCDKKC